MRANHFSPAGMAEAQAVLEKADPIGGHAMADLSAQRSPPEAPAIELANGS
ncbi:MAG: hypothetical protein ACRYGK_13530 [Janthinobacterium lividum]